MSRTARRGHRHRAARARFGAGLGLGLILLSGCGELSALSDVGRPPTLSPTKNPTTEPGWRPVSLPMPAPEPPPPIASSLWRLGSRSFFKDQRAAHVGDVITVLVNIADAAIVNDATTAQHNGAETMGVPNFFGLETKVPKAFPGANPASLVNTSSTSNANLLSGNGIINRNETITVRIAGEITQTLPNGNMVVVARQEVEVNSELRELTLTGIIRPQDIASDNTITHDRLAEARIVYGGRGQLTQVQTARWGQQILDILLPF